MKKVVYSIRKVRNSDEKLSGLGFINDEGTLFCKCVSKNGKRYTRAFDDVEQHCFPVFGKENEYKGYVTMYYEYEGRDIEVESLLFAEISKNISLMGREFFHIKFPLNISWYIITQFIYLLNSKRIIA